MDCGSYAMCFRTDPRRESFERQQLPGIYAHHFVIYGPINRAEPVPRAGRYDHYIAGAHFAAHAIFKSSPAHASELHRYRYDAASTEPETNP